jgi:hypothetical protein
MGKKIDPPDLTLKASTSCVVSGYYRRETQRDRVEDTQSGPFTSLSRAEIYLIATGNSKQYR